MSDLITITGNVATEPERRQTATGVPVTTFRLASSQRHFDRAKNEWIETSTNWYSVSAFRQLAEHVGASLHKGERVILTGRLRLREWETTVKRGLSVEIDAEAIGHDLRWGTTTFERALRPGDGVHRDNAGEVAAARPEAGDAWATPPLAGGGDWGAPAAVPATMVAQGPMAKDDVPF